MFSPWNFSRIELRIESDFLAIDDDTMFPKFHMMGESAVCRIILKKILEVFGVQHRIIDNRNVDTPGILES